MLTLASQSAGVPMACADRSWGLLSSRSDATFSLWE